MPADGERVFQITDPNEWGATPQEEPSITPTAALVGFIGLCLLLGVADAALISGPARAWYMSLVHPAGAIPQSLFRPVWALVYVGSGTAAWLVWRQGAVGAAAALRLWGWTLVATAVRTAFLFGARSLPGALVMSVVSGALFFAIIRGFSRQSRAAGWLMVPSLLWSGYLVFLSLGLLQLNPG